MRALLGCFAGLTAALVLCAGLARAEERVALVIGNGNYIEKPLSNPVRDAHEVSAALTAIGFEVTTIVDADLVAFDVALRDFEAAAAGADVALFYFAGHGFAVSDGAVLRNYLMPVSADITATSERLLRSSGMPLDEIIDSVSRSARTTLIFVDACRNEPAVRSVSGAGRGFVLVSGRDGSNVFVGLSTSAGDVATDGPAGEGSPFARAFAAHIQSPGQRLDDAFTQMRIAVRTETGAAQEPEVLRYNLDRPVVLVAGGGEAPIPPAAPRIAVTWRPAYLFDLGWTARTDYNDLALRAAGAWSAETGVDYLRADLEDDRGRAALIREQAGRGANPIVMTGFTWSEALNEVAPEFPDANFVLIDSVVDLPNVQSVLFDENVGSFLVGALAALRAEGQAFAFIGGMDQGVVRMIGCGFRQGVHAIAPNAEVREIYLGTTPAGWNDVEGAYDAAMVAIDDGVDVIYVFAGGAGMGAHRAAAQRGALSIGAEINQNFLFPGSVLTSMVKRVDLVLQQAFYDAGDDTTFRPGIEFAGLSSGVVGYAVDEYNARLVTPAMRDRVDELARSIGAGQLEVHNALMDDSCP